MLPVGFMLEATAVAALAAAVAGTLNNRDLLLEENIDCVGDFAEADIGLIPSDDFGAEPDKLTGEGFLDEVKLFAVETSLLTTVPSPPFLFFLYFLLAGIYYIFILYNYT